MRPDGRPVGGGQSDLNRDSDGEVRDDIDCLDECSGCRIPEGVDRLKQKVVRRRYLPGRPVVAVVVVRAFAVGFQRGHVVAVVRREVGVLHGRCVKIAVC